MAKMQDDSYEASSRREPDPVEAQIILRTLSGMVDPLSKLIPGPCEVVLHDLSLLPNSIVAISGDITGRAVGGLATDLLLRVGVSDEFKSTHNYPVRVSEDQVMRGSTQIFRDSAGVAVAALCVNSDTTFWRQALELSLEMLPDKPKVAETGLDEDEEIVHDVDQMSDRILVRAVSSVGVPPELMKKQHKLDVVRELQERGFFLLKESVDTAAAALGVTRFTIYNYIHELDFPDADSSQLD